MESNPYIDEMPQGAVFMGYGGTAPDYETFVFSYRGCEVRFPRHPEFWNRENDPDYEDCGDVGAEYGCISGEGWADVIEQLDEMDGRSA